MTDRPQPLPQKIEDPVGCGVRELLPEALEIAECIFVDEADEAEELQKRILQRRRGEKQFLFLGERLLEGVRDDIRRLVDIAKAVGLIDDDEIPGGGVDVRRFAPRELVGTDDDRSIEVQRPEVTALDGLIV